ncbi:hypothetical protein UVI_02014770 [Ustilaginoidea virens]|uniref:Uncharacterized protein n=1 Tax=Ustilaginoidea virens TaxID=1159556 RepID=A0A1B5L6U7_USTVR|nr:hypothetical protein UVI_02014770 [Ustilaginoidea virens]
MQLIHKEAQDVASGRRLVDPYYTTASPMALANVEAKMGKPANARCRLRLANETGRLCGTVGGDDLWSLRQRAGLA